MAKQRFQYRIIGYRWAPESFRVSKGLPGQKKKAVPLSSEECQEVGYRFITKGFRAAVGYVKHIERKRTQKSQLYVTYGFWLQEKPQWYLYCPRVYCPADAPLADRLAIFKTIRDDLTRRACQIETSTQCELDGAYRPIHVTSNTVTADLSRPLVVWLRCAVRKEKAMSELLQVVRPIRATVEAKAFSDALKNARALLRKSVIPFLEQVYVQFSGGTCILTGTDLNSWIISELPAQGDDFSFVFSRTKDVERACRYFDGTLTLEMTETQGGVISLSCGSRTGEFEIYPAETYPAVPKPKGEVSFRTNVTALLERIEKVSYATKKPGQSHKEIASCVEFSGNQVFALDGQRAAWDLDNAQTFPQPFLVHAEPLRLLKLFGDMQADFYISKPNLYVMGKSISAIFHMVEDAPYDLHSSIPQTYVEEFLVSPKKALQELKYLNDVVPRARKLYVYLRGNELFMTVNERKYSTTLDLGRQDGQVIMFELHHMTDAFKQFEKEPQVKVKISGGITPVVIEAEGRSDCALVLPTPMKENAAA